MSLGKPGRVATKDLPLTRLLPNLLTLLSLCSGLTAIRFATQEKWEPAVIAIVVAGIFDMLDGRVARMLNIASKFGAELDSLSDAISFGVAPSFVMYEWTMKDAGGLGWIAVLCFAVCSALRLARFNTMLDDQTAPAWMKGYFYGVPAPGGAGLAILPLTLFLEIGPDAHLPPVGVAIWLMLVGALMVSRLPTFALKGWRVAPMWVAPIFVVAVLLIAALITEPWLTLSCVGIVYIITIPLAFWSFIRRQKCEGTA